MVNEHRKSAECFAMPGRKKLQTVASIIREQPAMTLIERVTPETAQTPSSGAVEPRIDHRSYSVKTHSEARAQHDVPQKVSESMVTQKSRRARLEDAADFAHHLGFIRVGNRHGANQAVKRRRTHGHLLRLGQHHKQVVASTFRERVPIDIQPDADAAALLELFQFFPAAATNVDDTSPRRE